MTAAIITLEADRYRLTLAPEHGATTLCADWLQDDGTRLPILEPLLRPQDALNAGCFFMAPFANRIRGGRFPFAGREVSFPMNRPASDMACHGYARDLAWTLQSGRGDQAVVGCMVDDANYPWRFCMTQQVRLSAEGICIDLQMQNTGDAPLPFGFGLHPWFPRPEGTVVTFSSAGAYRQDAVGLPVAHLEQHPAFDASAPLALDGLPTIDLCFAGWQPRSARIEWPTLKTALDLRGHGALKHLHVYVPEMRPVLCLEPVSHVPDVINRPELGADASMRVLAPGQILKGGMSLRISTLDSPRKASRSLPTR